MLSIHNNLSAGSQNVTDAYVIITRKNIVIISHASWDIPLLDLELEHVIPDELHLMLRVMDVVIQDLIDTVLAYNRHRHRLSHSHGSFKPLDGPMLNNLVMSIRKCRVYFCLYEQGNGSMEWPPLLGPDKIKLNKFGNCQPAEMAKDVQKL